MAFHCPGCGCSHVVRVEGPGAWGWNGSMDRPTFTPSVLVTPNRCHLFVRDGRIEFLRDCHHALAGQTVDMAEVES